MKEYIDVRKTGWGTDCESSVWKAVTKEDLYGNEYQDFEWDNKLICNRKDVNAKTEYCSTCGKYLVYP